MTDLEPLIRSQGFFSILSDEQIQLLVGCACNTRFETGELIFQMGVKADEFFLLRAGLVALEIPVQGKENIRIQTIAAGEILGWSWLFPPFLPYFNARVVEPVRAIGFDGACIRGKSEENNALGYALMKLFAQVFRQRLHAAQLQLVDLYESPVDPAVPG